MLKCKCSKSCTEYVRTKGRIYAYGHNPLSHKNSVHKPHSLKVKKHMSKIWHATHMKDGHGPRFGAKHSVVTRSLISESRQNNAHYGVTSGWIKGPRRVYTSKHGLVIKMRSWWEVRFAKWLDKIGVIWQYEPRSFFVGDEGWGGYTYTPDFYIPRQHLYVEIKGWLTPQADWKMERFRQCYPKKRLWMFFGKDLKKIGVVA